MEPKRIDELLAIEIMKWPIGVEYFDWHPTSDWGQMMGCVEEMVKEFHPKLLWRV